MIEQILRDEHADTAVPRVCAAVIAALPCEGGAVMMMSSDMQRELMFASDEVVAEFERAQFNLGEGPSLQAFTESRPVLLWDFTARSVLVRWPMLLEQVARLPLGGVFCFPMSLGAIRLGVCTLYRRRPRVLEAADRAVMLTARDLLIEALLDVRASRAGLSPLGLWLSTGQPRDVRVAQATGMLIVQLGVSAEAAFARLRAHAYTEKRDIAQVAEDIVRRRLRLEVDATPEQ